MINDHWQQPKITATERAILEVVARADGELTVAMIAREIGATEYLTQCALDRLIDLDLVEPMEATIQ